MPGRVVRRSTYVKEYEELTHKDGVPFVPDAIWKDMFFSAAIIVSVMACAWFFGPFGPTGYPDPTIVQTIPKPDFFFLWLYAMLALLPPSMETPALLIGPVIVIGFLILLPFLSGEGEKSWKRRPIAVVTLLLIAVALGTFTQLATLFSLEPDHERLERRSRAGRISQRTLAAGTPGRAGLPGETVSQLSLDRRFRWTARPRARQRRHQPHSRSACAPGDSGRRQHACLWQEPESGRSDCPGLVPRDAATRQPARGA